MDKKKFIKLIITILLIVITFCCGYNVSRDIIFHDMPLIDKIWLIFFGMLPFIFYLLFAIFAYIKKCNKTGIILIISIPTIFIYYVICGAILCTCFSEYPKINPKYYSKKIKNSSSYKEFPTKIPSNAKDIYFYNNEWDTTFLYYIDDNMTQSEMDNKYSDKALLVGNKTATANNKCLKNEPFRDTPIDNKDNQYDFKIYLLECDCSNKDDESCDYGHYLYVAFNENTHEIIYKRYLIW